MYRAQPESAPILLVVSPASIEAVDRRTGRLLWRHALSSSNHRGAIASRIVVEGERVVVLSAGDLPTGWLANATVPGIVTCLDYRTGRLAWQQRFDVGTVITNFAGTLLVDSGQVLVALPTCVFAYSLADGAPQWRHDIAAPQVTGSTALALPGLAAQADRGD